MNRSQNLIVGAVVLIAAVLVVVVMLWPQDKSRPEEDRGREVQVEPSDEPKVARSLEALRQRARGLDAGEIPSAASTGQGAVFATFGWGSAAGQLGHKRPDEANPEAPMSVALDRFGNVTVLDQVNDRVVKLDKTGKVIGTTPLTVQGAQDLTIAADGTTLVLDRVIDKSVAVIGPDGKLVGELKLEGKNLEEGGAATGVFTDGEDVYVEREHGDLVKLGTTKGVADPDREEVPGRLSRDGTAYLTAGISVPGEDRVYVGSLEKASKQQRFQREYRLGMPVTGLMLLDTDRSGIIYLGALTTVPVPNQPEAEGRPMVLLLCLDPLDGRPLGRAELPANVNADETFRELVVADEGGVLYLYRTEEKAQLQKYDCR
ncbi:MAG: hypothetical protein H6Q89_3946 [Myxococcaceae bacterium]|nr:hypothetical protein [Myxococcaceae bacterium]